MTGNIPKMKSVLRGDDLPHRLNQPGILPDIH